MSLQNNLVFVDECGKELDESDIIKLIGDCDSDSDCDLFEESGWSDDDDLEGSRIQVSNKSNTPIDYETTVSPEHNTNCVRPRPLESDQLLLEQPSCSYARPMTPPDALTVQYNSDLSSRPEIFDQLASSIVPALSPTPSEEADDPSFPDPRPKSKPVRGRSRGRGRPIGKKAISQPSKPTKRSKTQTSNDTAPPKKKKKEGWQWTSTIESNIINKIPFTGCPGVRASLARSLGSAPSELDVFNAFLDNDFWQHVATETNNYAKETIKKKNEAGGVGKTIYSEWFDTTADEMACFYTLCVLMSLVKKRTIQSYWSPNAVTETPFFRKVMPFRRFLLLSTFFHLTDNNRKPVNDKLWKLRYVIEYMNRKFSHLYIPDENIAVDESLMKFRGRLGYVQFNPKKRARFGIKFYKCCESGSAYCSKFKIYTGAEVKENVPVEEGSGDSTQEEKLLTSEAIVVEMTKDLAGKGHTLTIDNWYSSPLLFYRLKQIGFNVIGTANWWRSNMPESFKEGKLKLGDYETAYSHDMLAVRWQDKKQVCILSTFHQKADKRSTGKKDRVTQEIITKPEPVIYYNRSMGGIDREDQQLASFPSMRRYAKGYKKIFFYIMDIGLFNSYVVFKKLTRKKLGFSEFKERFVKQMFESRQLPPYNRRGRSSNSETPLRLQAATWGHFPRPIPPNEVKQTPSRRCKVCSAQGKRSDSRWECELCLVALHMPECFKAYHTKMNFA
ncbi:piggyBac transposable element-derived protein 4-like [Macrosteles quadrilineatus]|uniref:piggyBac transposable element-derived protein 4-like n=1 Tax=Macrosteles quadrilineatus TaxID=74068 RepID=UPI0023E10C75|nr:piggyBac transposable element-derived protein 4-like [Macrosteles quadrilineatus]